MRSFKIYLILALAILLIGSSFGCDGFNPFGPKIDDDDNDDEQKFKPSSLVVSERIGLYVSTDYNDQVRLNISSSSQVEGWQEIQGLIMEKVSEKEFQSTVLNLPADVVLYFYTQDRGRMRGGGDEFSGEGISINGIQLRIVNDPWGNGWRIATCILNADTISH